MAVEIKSGDSTDLLTVDPLSKSMRVTNYNSDGIEGFQSLPIDIPVVQVSAAGGDIISSLDVQSYKFVVLQLTGTWVATITFQGSNDGGTFFPILSSDPSGGIAIGQTTATSNRLIKIPTLFKFLRVKVTAHTSGTVEGVAFGHRDENSSGLIAAIGPVTLQPETTKVIGTVNIAGTGGTQEYFKIISQVGLNSNLVKNSAGKVTILHLVNSVATARYFKMYNKDSAPIVGIDVPLFTVSLPTGATTFTLPALVGIDFSLGIAFAITLGVADGDATPDTVVGAVTGLIAYV
jgi:hypothetical protein